MQEAATLLSSSGVLAVSLAPSEGGSAMAGLMAIAALGIGAQWLAWRLKLPSILLLLAFGLGAGSLGWVDPDALFGELLFPIVSLSVGVILFEGGLTLELAELTAIRRVLTRLVSIGVLVTFALATWLAWALTPLGLPLALLCGAILTVTGPTVIGPLLRQVRPNGAVGAVAKWEGIVVDVIGATLAVIVFEALLVDSLFSSTTGALFGFVKTLALGALLGHLGALVLGASLRRHWIPDQLQSPVVLGAVLTIYAVSQELAHESGLLAVTWMGFRLGNQHETPVRHIVEFKENLRTLLISGLFILLSARLDITELLAAPLGSWLFVVALILVVRPLSVWLSTMGTELTGRETLFLAFLAPRGIVAAAVSSLFALRLEAVGYTDAAQLAQIVFLVILVSVAVYGLSAGPLARSLGLAVSDPQGVLLVGAGPFARELSNALLEEEVPVLLVDTNRDNIAAARLAGLPALYGNALGSAIEDAELGGIGRLIAATPNDEVNALACLHFTELFGRVNTYQLAAHEAEDHAGGVDMRGRLLFDGEATFARLGSRMLDGATIKITTLSDEFPLHAWLDRYEGRVLPLARLDPEGRLHLFMAGDEVTGSAGERIIGLIDAAAPGDEQPDADTILTGEPASSTGSTADPT